MDTQEVVLMEGSFGPQLSKHVGDILDGDVLWSARFLHTDKDKCILTHRDLLRAGTQILTTGSYQATVDGFMEHLGLSREKAVDLIKDSVYLAREAVKAEEEAKGGKLCVQIAGSVGPYGAYLHDGSDYTGSYAGQVTEDFLMDWHRPRVEALVQAGADLIAFETIPALMEGRALIRLLKEFPSMKAWISFSCRDGSSISTGENFKEVAKTCWSLGAGQLIAVGVNCLHPDLVVPLFKDLRKENPEIPLMAYPNSGEVYNKEIGRWMDKVTSKCLTDYTEEWLNLGVKYVGGCCRTSDKDVEQFKIEILKWKEKATQMNKNQV